MLKVIKNNKEKTKIEPFFTLEVTLGYGEHCNDTFTHNHLVINDEKASKYDSLTDEDMDNMDIFEIMDLSKSITQNEAEKIVKFFDSIWERKDEDGFNVTNVILNDGPSHFWWQKMGGMSDEEFEWFSEVYDKYECDLFEPEIEHNWYGITNVGIYYYDENNEKHNVEII